jgi:hypothetical protein
MTDPNQYVADQIGAQATVVRGEAASEQDIAQAAQRQAGLGVTGVDVEALAAQIAQLQAQVNDMNAAKAAEAGNPLADTVKSVAYFLAGHGDPKAVALGEDLAAAVTEAGKSGNTGAVAKLADRLSRHLAKNPPYPGENYHYRNAVAFTSDLPDLIDAFKPVPAQTAGALGSSQAPAKVVAGSVVG